MRRLLVLNDCGTVLGVIDDPFDWIPMETVDWERLDAGDKAYRREVRAAAKRDTKACEAIWRAVRIMYPAADSLAETVLTSKGIVRP